MLAMAFAAMGDLSNPLDANSKTSIKDIDFTPKKPPIPKGCKLYWFTQNGNYEDFDFIPLRIPDFVVYKTIASSRKVAFSKYKKWKQSQVVS